MTCSLVQFGMGADSFSPKSLPGLVLWLRPDVGVTVVAGKVTAVADQSGAGNNFTGSNITIDASGIGGRPSFSSTSASASYLEGVGLSNAIVSTSAAERIYVGQNATDPPSGGSTGSVEVNWGSSGQGSNIPYTSGGIYDGFASTSRVGAPISHTVIDMSQPYVVDTVAGTNWE